MIYYELYCYGINNYPGIGKDKFRGVGTESLSTKSKLALASCHTIGRKSKNNIKINLRCKHTFQNALKLKAGASRTNAREANHTLTPTLVDLETHKNNRFLYH